MSLASKSEPKAAADNETTGSSWVRRPLPLSRIFGRLIVAGAVLVAVGELGARVDERVRYGTPMRASPDMNGDLTIQDSLGLRGRPYGQFKDFHLNSAGFRSPESTLTKATGCVRVMTFGSSETFGYEEPPGKEYPAQLADSLSTRGCFQVVNAGIVGVAVPAMNQLYDHWGSRFAPDVVVILPNPIGYLREDPPQPPAPKFEAPSSVQRPFRPRLPAWVRDLVQYPDFIQHRRTERMVEQLVAGRPAEWFYRDVPRERLDQFRHDVDSIVSTVIARGATPVLIVHPIRFRDLSQPNARSQMQAMRQFSPQALPEVLLQFDSAGASVVRDVATRRGIPFVDLPPLMNGHYELFADPVHYSPAGSAVIAGAVATTIVKWRAAHSGM